MRAGYLERLVRWVQETDNIHNQRRRLLEQVAEDEEAHGAGAQAHKGRIHASLLRHATVPPQ